MPSASQFVADLAARGRYHFTTDEARSALEVSLAATRAALRVLKRRGEIADPHRGFHVIVPPEYRRIGCLPAEQFIFDLMQHLGEPYYAALLSAAEIHGAAHQRPQRFQVMLRKNQRAITCGKVHVEFIARRDMEQTPTATVNTPRGFLRVSTPEATALELVGYADRSGGLDNVVSVIAELGERLQAGSLLSAAKLCPVAWCQRLGYLLELTDQPVLADALADHVHENASVVAALVRADSITGSPRASRWKLALNAQLEPDL